MSVTSAKRFLALGPESVTVANCSVTDVMKTSNSGHSVWMNSSMWASTAAALPEVVVMTK